MVGKQVYFQDLEVVLIIVGELRNVIQVGIVSCYRKIFEGGMYDVFGEKKIIVLEKVEY